MQYRCQYIPLDTGPVVVATSANTCRLPLISETVSDCDTRIWGCEELCVKVASCASPGTLNKDHSALRFRLWRLRWCKSPCSFACVLLTERVIIMVLYTSKGVDDGKKKLAWILVMSYRLIDPFRRRVLACCWSTYSLLYHMCNILRGMFSVRGTRQCECLYITAAFIYAGDVRPHAEVLFRMVVA